MRFTVYLAAAAATLAVATPAVAQQASANALAKGVVVQPLDFAKDQDLDFGTVVGSAVAGNVVIDADTGGRTIGGGVTGVPSFPGDRGLFTGAGTAGQTVLLTLNAPAVLVSQSNPLDLITVNQHGRRQRRPDARDRRIGHFPGRRRAATSPSRRTRRGRSVSGDLHAYR